MSLLLEQNTKPEGLEVKTRLPDRVWIGKGPFNFMGVSDIDMSITDFCEMVKYVLTNTDLTQDDPREELRQWVSELGLATGYSGKGARLAHVELDESLLEKVKTSN